MKILKKYSGFVILLIIHEFLVFFIKNNLDPIHYAPQNFLFSDLMGNKFFLPSTLLFLLEAGNLSLFWLISKKFFDKQSLLPVLIYGLIPWSSYLVAGNSFYIYLLFLLLISFYGLLLIKHKRLLGSLLVIVGIIAGMYSSLSLLLILPIILCMIVISRMIPFNVLKTTLVSLTIFMIPLFFLIYNNRLSFGNILNNEVKLFSDPGLINMVNSYQGNSAKEGFNKLAKISENRYIFVTEYIFLKYIKHLVPTTYFTQQEKLLNFSFNPPIYLGFLIPFLYGLYKIFQSSMLRKAFFLSTLIVIPSILSKQMVDLNRQILFAPVIIFVISYGFRELLELRKKTYFFLSLTLILVVFQFLVTLSDIQFREKDRYVKYFGQNYEIGKQ